MSRSIIRKHGGNCPRNGQPILGQGVGGAIESGVRGRTKKQRRSSFVELLRQNERAGHVAAVQSGAYSSDLSKEEIRIKWLKKRHELAKLKMKHGVTFY